MMRRCQIFLRNSKFNSTFLHFLLRGNKVIATIISASSRASKGGCCLASLFMLLFPRSIISPHFIVIYFRRQSLDFIGVGKFQEILGSSSLEERTTRFIYICIQMFTGKKLQVSVAQAIIDLHLIWLYIANSHRAMALERDIFSLSGPLHLTTVDWNNVHHCRSVVASLVHGVYVLERDHQQKRKGHQSLAPPWWEFFHFQLLHQLMDDVDFSIFGAIYEFKPPGSSCHRSVQEAPRYVIAFRGTMIRPHSCRQEDLRLGRLFIINRLHGTSRVEVALEAIRNMVAAAGALNIWLAGHSLGSAMAILTGKNMAKTGVFLQAFLFNSPYISPPIERIKDKKLKQAIRMAESLITAGLTVAVKGHQSEDAFVVLSGWVPSLFVNLEDDICSEYVGYFEQREKMEEIGASRIGKLATQNSIGNLLFGNNKSEPLHLLPSANLTINLSPYPDMVQAHSLRQWWRPDLHLHCKLYQYRWK